VSRWPLHLESHTDPDTPPASRSSASPPVPTAPADFPPLESEESEAAATTRRMIQTTESSEEEQDADDGGLFVWHHAPCTDSLAKDLRHNDSDNDTDYFDGAVTRPCCCKRCT